MNLFELQATLGLDTSNYENGIKGASDSIDKLATKIGDLTTKAFKLVINVAWDFAKDVWDTGLAFESVIGSVNAVTKGINNGKDGFNEINAEMLQSKIIAEAMTSAFTTAEVAWAAYYQGLAGYNYEESMAGLHGLVALAEATGEDLQGTADILTDSVTMWNEGAAAQEHFGDVMAATATSSNTNVRKLGQALKYVGPIAHSLGQSFESTNIALGLLADIGIKGSQGGTTLRNIFTRLAADVSGARDTVLASLGVDFIDKETGKVRDFIDVLRDIRAVWGQVTIEQQRSIIDVFGSSITDRADPTELMRDFNNTIEQMREEYNALETDAERYAYAHQLTFSDEFGNEIDIYGALAQFMPDIHTTENTAWQDFTDFNELLDEIQTNYNQMTDSQKLEAAYVMASMRAMSGFLGLIEISDEKFDELAETVYDAEGAMEAMKEARLDTVAGDVQMLTSRYDALKTLLFESNKSPLRNFLGGAISALDNTIEAFKEGGWSAGIQTAYDQLMPLFNDYVLPIVDMVAPILGNAFIKGIEWLALNGSNALVALGISLGKGILSGILQGLGPQAELDEENKEYQRQQAEIYVSALNPTETRNYGGVDIPLSVLTTIDRDQLAKNLQTMADNGLTDVDIEIGDGFVLSYEAAQNLLADLESTLNSPALGDTLGASLSEAGPLAGSNVASDIQNALSSPFTISVIPQLGGAIGSIFNGLDIFAQGMSGGRILRGSTIFGVGEDGRALQGGESGPEAVVGVNSLNQMIQSSVSSAVGAMLSRMDAMVDRISNYAPQIYLDTGALVGGLAPGMNGELNDIARWKGYGRS